MSAPRFPIRRTTALPRNPRPRSRRPIFLPRIPPPPLPRRERTEVRVPPLPPLPRRERTEVRVIPRPPLPRRQRTELRVTALYDSPTCYPRPSPIAGSPMGSMSASTIILTSLVEADPGRPLQHSPRLARVGPQVAHVRGPEVPGVDLDVLPPVEPRVGERPPPRTPAPSAIRPCRSRSRPARPAAGCATSPRRTPARTPSRGASPGCRDNTFRCSSGADSRHGPGDLAGHESLARASGSRG